MYYVLRSSHDINIPSIFPVSNKSIKILNSKRNVKWRFTLNQHIYLRFNSGMYLNLPLLYYLETSYIAAYLKGYQTVDIAISYSMRISFKLP